jgi:hypothetical protein
MAARQICLRVRLMKPQPSRTLILILCFASSVIGTKSSSSKFTDCTLHLLLEICFAQLSPSGPCICINMLETLFRQIDRDCEFLEAERIMDYSLLVGLHFRDDNTYDKMGLSPFLLRTGNHLEYPSITNHSWVDRFVEP